MTSDAREAARARPETAGRAQRVLRALCIASALAVTLLSVYQTFNLGHGLGYVFLENQVLYLVLGLLLPLIFLLVPLRRRGGVGLAVDLGLAAATAGLCGFLAWNAETIVTEGWEYLAPREAVWVSYLLWALALEATRRAGGWGLFAIVGLLSLYPLVAGDLPGFLRAEPVPAADAAIFHVMSEESLLGIPLRAFVQLVIGFMIFGVALQHTGGGRFFLELSFAALGHVRGGPAKVAIFSSGLMGSMSGSVITNVLTTGVMTIPAMRRVGFSRSFASGVEACASTGGVLMPPIMGATAFVMATYLETSYVEVALAAALPSVLYFFGLFCQIDARAARTGAQGLPRAELPRIGRTLREGWYFVAVFALLIWMLLILNRESWAPYFATAALLLVNQLSRRNRWGRHELGEFLAAAGRLFVELVAILAGIGFIVGSLVMTGKIGNIANDLLQLAGDSTVALLCMGALTAFVLGIGMTVTAAYIFLAVALAPALIAGGLNPVAVHLFILYWGMLSYITPPVALGAFAAATLSGARPMATGFQAMRLGSIIYAVPFFFVLEPALILQGDAAGVASTLVQALLGILLISAALENHLVGFGGLGDGAVGLAARLALALAGLLLALPGGAPLPIGNLALLLAAAGLAAGALLVARLRRPLPRVSASPSAAAPAPRDPSLDRRSAGVS